jgi:tRNA modification GTPase
MIFRDTIAAIATPPGIGGIGMIRVSGPAAEGIAWRLFRPSPSGSFLSHHLYHGEIVSPGTGAILDTVLTAFLKGPRSYTGEDTLEISCHGGPLVLRTVLEEVLRAGARPAERGEFTKRAYLNDRLDLAQAEAVLDIINAQTRPGLAAAVGRLKGNLSGRFAGISLTFSPGSRLPSTSPRTTASRRHPEQPFPAFGKSSPGSPPSLQRTIRGGSIGRGSASSSPAAQTSENPPS